MQERAHGVLFHAKFHCDQHIVLYITIHNHVHMTIFLNSGGLLYPHPWTNLGQSLAHYSRPTVYAYVPNLILIGSLCHPRDVKNSQFYHFSTLPSCSGSAGGQLQTFPCRTVPKPFQYSNAFMAKWLSQTLPFKSVMDKQTNKETRNAWQSLACSPHGIVVTPCSVQLKQN